MRAASAGRALAAITALAAALRFSGLGVQSFWLDEAYTVVIAKLGLGDVWHHVRLTEGTPPLYYYLANLWGRAFGTDEAGLRSLSALFGTATVPAAFWAARELVSERAGLVTALLVAVNPWLVWYSQEARSYALLVLLTTLALVFFARGGPRDLLLWGAFSALAICTHYFAVFTVAPEAAWLLLTRWRARERLRPLLAAIAGIVAVSAALIPYALDQRSGSRQSFIHDLPRGTRLEDLVRHPLAGELGGPVHGFVQAAAVLVAVAAVLVFARAGARERRGALVALGIAVASVLVPLALSFTSLDYLFARNSIPIVVPAVVFVAAGLAAPRGGRIALLALAGLCALWIAVDVATPLEDKLQRDDWRGAVRALGPARQPRVVATSPFYFDVPLTTYLRPATRMGSGGAVASELDVVRLRRGAKGATGPVAIPGFAPVRVKRTVSYELDSYRAASPTRITPATLAAIRPSSAAFVQP